ncbi:protein disulfide isomerase-like 5-4 [Dorcoceras hygrometricum]|uniref:Protein disulfide isomerase-like 5-4 n=1 Tax=Dorcoceras hygrometricum TaxID=472368 RepID=A0A2Z7BJC3_9LAMI|nr:protein disulfide isomerase-like 5-4 [Dorcoceras hygrometricum]
MFQLGCPLTVPVWISPRLLNQLHCTSHEKIVPVVKKQEVVVKNPVEAKSQAAPATSTSGTSSDADSRPLVKLGAIKRGGAKRKQVVDSSNLESTVSLPLVKIMKKQRTQRTKPARKIAGDQAGFNPGPIPEIRDGADDASTTGDPAAKGKEILEAFARQNPVEEHCLLVLKSSWEDVSNKMCEYDNGYTSALRPENVGVVQAVRDGGATPAQQEKPKILSIEFSTQSEQAQMAEKQPAQQEGQVEEIVRAVENIDETEAMNSKKHQAQQNEQQAQAEEKPAQNDEHQAYERQAQASSSTSCPNLAANIKLKEMQKVVLSLESKIASMDSRAVSLDSKVDRIMDAQTFMKLDFGLYKRTFYENMDKVVANVTS